METNEKIKGGKTEKLADSELWKKSKRGLSHDFLRHRPHGGRY